MRIILKMTSFFINAVKFYKFNMVTSVQKFRYSYVHII